MSLLIKFREIYRLLCETVWNPCNGKVIEGIVKGWQLRWQVPVKGES